VAVRRAGAGLKGLVSRHPYGSGFERPIDAASGGRDWPGNGAERMLAMSVRPPRRTDVDKEDVGELGALGRATAL